MLTLTDIEAKEAENEQKANIIQRVHDGTALEKAVVTGYLARLRLDGGDAQALTDLEEAILNLELAAVEAATDL